MYLNLAEVAPAAPAVVEMIPPLLILSGLLFALGCATLIQYFAKAVLGALAGIFSIIPFVGSITAAAIRSLEQWIVHELGNGISKIEGAIGHQWHNLARVAGHLWGVIVRLAYVSWEIAKLTQGLVSLSTIRHWVHDLRQAISHALHIGTQGLHKAVHVEKTVARILRHGVYPRLKAAEHAIDVTLPKEIKSARALAREAEDGVARLWAWTRDLATNPALTAAIATAIAALGLVGIDLIKCRESGSMASKRGCSVWSSLDDLLGLVALGIVAADFEELVHEAQDLTQAATTVFDDVFGLSR